MQLILLPNNHNRHIYVEHPEQEKFIHTRLAIQ